ncbi:MAG: hypothetical protein KAY24_08805, partial [Candidatus Eisenbacteria sp.]|nr:hypothetical protein [Candidatus Eisenbacteria bacterium]
MRSPGLPAAGLIILAVCFAVATLMPFSARATPYWGPAEIEGKRMVQQEQIVPWPSSIRHDFFESRSPLEGKIGYLEMFGRIAEFLSIWQVHDPGDPAFGGMREGEHLPDIIQTDNTSESIWVWSRYRELTGDDQYHQNILDAFTYSMNYPAYLEEGTSSPVSGYYRMYNCGWATRAELKYRQVYGDDTYKDYGDSCASYIRYHTLDRPSYWFYRYVNPPVLSWALGNLYFAGIHGANVEWMEEAVRQARERVKVWVEEEPELLGNETWAMSGGATMWGLLSSFFSAHPESADAWVPLYKDWMDVFSDPGEFQNAWNGWYALGHWATGTALDDPYHLDLHIMLADTLIAEDGDGDGGIPARPEDSDDMDQTWVSNYLAFMGLHPLLAPAAALPP